MAAGYAIARAIDHAHCAPRSKNRTPYDDSTERLTLCVVCRRPWYYCVHTSEQRAEYCRRWSL